MRILFLEDDPRVASGVLRLVRNMGHEAIHARTVPDAIALIEAGACDGVLADQGLPNEESGTDLVHWLATHRPSIPRALTTGGQRPSGFLVAPPYQTFLYKPFGRADLEQMFDHMRVALEQNASDTPAS